jgi:hypothetical protein
VLSCNVVNVNLDSFCDFVKRQLKRTLCHLPALGEVVLREATKRATVKVFTFDAVPRGDKFILDRIVVCTTDW